jgi:DNA-binding response OmpR family regulator
MHLLLITKSEQNRPELLSFLTSNQINFDTAEDQLVGIQKAYQSQYDVVVLDAEEGSYHIDKAIRILKDCNPKVRIIVRTELNTRELEIKVRKENIFYYHVNSFGNQEFTSALSSALELDKKVH